MNLSNRLTFSLIFSVVLAAAFALAVAPAMADEGGPQIESLVLDASKTTGTDGPDNSASATEDNIPAKDTVSNGKALLTTTGQFKGVDTPRADLVDVGADDDDLVDGTFRLILTFDQDVYANENAKPDAPSSDPDPDLHDQGATRTGTAVNAGDITNTDFTILSALGITDGNDVNGNDVNISISDVTRVDNTPDDATDDEWSLRKFYVTVQVEKAAYSSLPINIALTLHKNRVYGIGKNRVITPFAPAKDGLGNVGYLTPDDNTPDDNYKQFDFQVIARAISDVSIEREPSGEIGSHQPVELTLTFDPGLNASDVPTRDNIVVTNGDIKEDDSSTEDMDEGITDMSADDEPRTEYKVTILPRGGLGETYDITVKNAVGAAFEFNETITVNNKPEEQHDVTFTGPDDVPAAGAPFTVKIEYTVAPATPLTVAGITVDKGSIVANSFTGSGKSYSVQIDPDDPTEGNPVTVTVQVGEDKKTFMTSVEEEETPHPPTFFTLTAGLDAGEYLVVTPATIVYDDVASTTDVDERMNVDVLPRALAEDMRETQADMPDLEDLLYGGGTVDVYVDADEGDPTPDIIINEVMWGLDENEVGTAGHTAHQWIELYNNSSDDAGAETITLWFKPRMLAGAPTDKGTRTDRLSNVLRFETITGWKLGDNHGQSGNSNEESTKEFISMYRKSDKRGDDDGINGAHWLESTELSHVKHRGTPGKENTRSAVTVKTRLKPTKFTPLKDQVIINEVFNASGTDNDWIEIQALKTTNLENWIITKVTAAGTETEICRFPKVTIPEGDIWLLISEQPTKEGVNLAPGHDLNVTEEANQDPGRGTHKYKIISWKDGGLPDDTSEYLLTLRTGKGWERLGSRDRLHDVVGPATFDRKTLAAAETMTEDHSGDPKQIWDTEIWPLNGWTGLKATGADGANNSNAYLDPNADFDLGQAWARNGTNNGFLKGGGSHAGYKGGIGYDRAVSAEMAQGTPGYDNGAYKTDGADATANVIITEIMYAHKGGTQDPPQWIELYNPSSTISVNLDNFRLTITNHDQTVDADGNMEDWDGAASATVLLNGLSLPPKETVLIVSATARREKMSIPDHRIYNTFKKNKGAFGQKVRGNAILNQYGFNITLHAKGNDINKPQDWQLADSVGNLAERRTGDDRRRGEAEATERFDDVRWNWPNAFNEEDERVSVARTHKVLHVPDGGNFVDPGKNLGTESFGWVLSSEDGRTNRIDIVYFGQATDIGTPGQTVGQPLPVSLSFFRPTLEDGKVVIRWTTESELDNAGFNILRSQDRNGEFTKVNDKLVQGKGTTAERSTYKWVDSSAKPGAVYYYQIEDVSFAGERNTLTTTKLKGLISAKNKLTTRWGELKSQN